MQFHQILILELTDTSSRFNLLNSALETNTINFSIRNDLCMSIHLILYREPHTMILGKIGIGIYAKSPQLTIQLGKDNKDDHNINGDSAYTLNLEI